MKIRLLLTIMTVLLVFSSPVYANNTTTSNATVVCIENWNTCELENDALTKNITDLRVEIAELDSEVDKYKPYKDKYEVEKNEKEAVEDDLTDCEANVTQLTDSKSMVSGQLTTASANLNTCTTELEGKYSAVWLIVAALGGAFVYHMIKEQNKKKIGIKQERPTVQPAVRWVKKR